MGNECKIFDKSENEGDILLQRGLLLINALQIV